MVCINNNIIEANHIEWEIREFERGHWYLTQKLKSVISDKYC